jgi:hypothetical protein
MCTGHFNARQSCGEFVKRQSGMAHHCDRTALLSFMQKVVRVVPLPLEGNKQITGLNRAGIGVHPLRLQIRVAH